MWQGEVRGEGRINRPGASTRNKRRWTALCGKSSWFKKEKRKAEDQEASDPTRRKKKRREQAEVESVLYVPHTEGSILKKTIQEVEDKTLKGKNTGRIRLVERQGSTLSHLLCNPAPWKSLHCGRPTCLPCKSKEGSCKKRNVTYQKCLLGGDPQGTLG